MYFNYAFADLDKEKKDVIEMISKLEDEISSIEDKDIVLIAYSKKD